ncbi:MAG: ABC transporter permease [Chloroflexota bacterium]|nr:ABC transporter permease [Chloroflexota bacterium]
MMDWRKVWVITRHEYLTNVRRAGFIIMTAIVPVLGIAVLLFGAFFSGLADQLGTFFEEQFDAASKRTGVVDRSGYFSPILQEYRENFVLYPGEAEAEAALIAEEVSSVLVVGEDYMETGQVVAVTMGSGFDAAMVSDSETMDAFFVDHLLAGQVDPALQKRAADPMNVEPRVISSGGETQGEGPWGFAFTFIIPYFLAIFLVMTIFTSSGYLLQSVGEEKESRVVEIVVSSVRPVELMTGKVVGLGALGLTQILVWLLSVWGFSGGAVALLAVAGAVSIPIRVLGLGVVYYLLGYMLYAILMAGVGALGATMRESQQLAGIFSFFAAVPYMLSGFLFANPNVLLARILSFFPLTAPTMMMLRLPLAEVGWVDVVGSIVALLLSIPAALWVGAKLFRVGLLMYDKRPTLREIWWILRGGGGRK